MDKITIDRLEESLRDPARELIAAGCTITVLPPLREHELIRYLYATKEGEPGIVYMQIGDFPRLGQPPRLAIPVRPSRTWGSAIALDVPRGKTIVETVLGALTHSMVTPRFVGPASPVPVDHRHPDTALELTLED